jgi:hypothetical protein
MRLGASHLSIGLVTVFIAIFFLFYIFDNIDKISKKCNAGSTEQICDEIGPGKFGVLVLIVLLIVGGLSVIVCSTAYILLTS